MARERANDMVSDLRSFSRLLEHFKFKEHKCIELEQLEKVIEEIDNYTKSGKKARKKVTVSIDDGGITFHTKTTGMTANPATKEDKLDVFLTMNYELNFDETELQDIMPSYNLNLMIKGVQKNHWSPHYFSWHQDMQDENEKGVKKSKYQFIHPLYHFHAGGSAIQSKGPGSLIMLGSPRLPHPPMDIILAINFVICNFFSTGEKKFEEEMKILDCDEYRRLLMKSAKRLYGPYYNEIMSKKDNSRFMPLVTT